MRRRVSAPVRVSLLARFFHLVCGRNAGLAAVGVGDVVDGRLLAVGLALRPPPPRNSKSGHTSSHKTPGARTNSKIGRWARRVQIRLHQLTQNTKAGHVDLGFWGRADRTAEQALAARSPLLLPAVPLRREQRRHPDDRKRKALS